jgi:uncharacterized CHY-type Zn-finger protein
MKITVKQIREVRDVVALQCDKCGKIYDDIYEIQEFLTIHFRGGFHSVFGDLDKVDGDICQHCLKNAFGDALRIKEWDGGEMSGEWDDTER